MAPGQVLTLQSARAEGRTHGGNIKKGTVSKVTDISRRRTIKCPGKRKGRSRSTEKNKIQGIFWEPRKGLLIGPRKWGQAQLSRS